MGFEYSSLILLIPAMPKYTYNGRTYVLEASAVAQAGGIDNYFKRQGQADKSRALASAAHVQAIRNLDAQGQAYKAFGYSSQAELEYWANKQPEPSQKKYEFVNPDGKLVNPALGWGAAGCRTPFSDASLVPTGEYFINTDAAEISRAKSAVAEIASYSGAIVSSATDASRPNPSGKVGSSAEYLTLRPATANPSFADITGTDGNDLLTGVKGKIQTFRGGKGDDIYYIDNILNSIVENPGEGLDTAVLSVDSGMGLASFQNVENLTLAGIAINGIGNDLNNKIQGNNLGNYLDGLNGVDVLTGLGGADTFAFSTSPTFGKSTADHLTDFNSSEGDSLRISKAAFGISLADTIKGVKTVYSPAELQVALGSAETFVYDRGLGELYFNQNGALAGAGNGGVFAILDNKSALGSISLVA